MGNLLKILIVGGLLAKVTMAVPVTWRYQTTVHHALNPALSVPAGTNYALEYTFDSSVIGQSGNFDLLSGTVSLGSATFMLPYSPEAITSNSGEYRVMVMGGITGTYNGYSADYFQFGFFQPGGPITSPEQITVSEFYGNLGRFPSIWATIEADNYAIYSFTQVQVAEANLSSIWRGL